MTDLSRADLQARLDRVDAELDQLTGRLRRRARRTTNQGSRATQTARWNRDSRHARQLHDERAELAARLAALDPDG